MVKMTKVIRKGSEEKATLATDCKLKERLERGARASVIFAFVGERH
jgi:hypothetical protein